MAETQENPIQARCKARSKSTGNRCRNRPIKGLEVCRMHGGNTKRARAAGARREEEHKIRVRVGRLLAAENVEYEDPLEGLLTEVARSAQAVRALGDLVADLEAHPGWRSVEAEDFSDEVPDGFTVALGVPGGIIGPDHLGDLGLHPYVQAWNAERERHAKFCKAALDAGVAERQVRLAERQGELMVRIIEALLQDPELGLSPSQRSLGRRVAAKHLRQHALPEAS